MADDAHEPGERRYAALLAAGVIAFILLGVLGAVFIGLEVPLYMALGMTPVFLGALIFMSATPDPGD